MSLTRTARAGSIARDPCLWCLPKFTQRAKFRTRSTGTAPLHFDTVHPRKGGLVLGLQLAQARGDVRHVALRPVRDQVRARDEGGVGATLLRARLLSSRAHLRESCARRLVLRKFALSVLSRELFSVFST